MCAKLEHPFLLSHHFTFIVAVSSVILLLSHPVKVLIQSAFVFTPLNNLPTNCELFARPERCSILSCLTSRLLSVVESKALSVYCFCSQFHIGIGHVGNLISTNQKSIMLQPHRVEELQVHLRFPGMVKASARLNAAQPCNIMVAEETASVV